MKKLVYGYSLVAALLVATAATTPAWALGWHDAEWAGSGCPSKLSGNWVPLTSSPYAGLKIEFKSTGVALSSKDNNKILFSFFQNPKDEQFLNFKRVSEDAVSFPKYLKIRPHMAVQSNSKGKKYALCKIKVFLFESRKKANQMSYLSWISIQQ